ncbi:MAG: D-alanine--D-alanine ligase, partial [Pseudomonadota bacterium]
LPSLANPKIVAGGAIGESKLDVFALAGNEAHKWIAPYASYMRTKASAEQGIETETAAARKAMLDAEIAFPIVAKPDSGLRGAGVRPVRNDEELAQYIAGFPIGERVVLQAMVPYEAEAGVFYVRHPQEAKGNIISLTLKYAAYVYGDGSRTLKQLIDDDPRASAIAEVYQRRLQDQLHEVPAAGTPIKLVFAGSHCRGSIFKNGADFITPEMVDAFDRISKDIDEFYFGRYDVRFRTIEDLQAGKHFQIVEVNGSGSEQTHIWDSRTTLKEAYLATFEQWRLSFEFGAANQQRGFQKTKLMTVLKLWFGELRRGRKYPETL